MATENYINPSSMYPLQTADTNSPAFGSGTVPGSFLSSALLPQRLQDYQGALDASMTSSRLANLRSGAELQDYLAGQGSRTSGYNLQQGEHENASALLPGQRTLAMGSQEQDIKDLPYANEMKAWKAVSALPVAKRQAALQEMTIAGDILRGIPDNVDPGLKLQTLAQYGVDVSHFKDLTPEQQQLHLQVLKKMDPKVWEHMAKMEEGQQTGEYGVKKAQIMGASKVEAARVRANIAKEIGAGKINEQQLFMMFNDAVAKDPAERDDQEQALVDHYEDYRSLYAGKKADVGEKAKARTDADSIANIKRDREVQKSVKERFNLDKGMSSNKLGPWDPDKKAYEVHDPETGKLIGHYK